MSKVGGRGAEFSDAGKICEASGIDKEPIAVIGIGCRFPGAVNSPADFWNLLIQGTDAVTEIPADRWNIEEYYRPQTGLSGMSYSKRGGFIDDIDLFDPEFFGITPREAPYIDPQQRLLLETAWKALEDAGQLATDLDRSNTGVFVGICTDDYSRIQADADENRDVSPHSLTGGAFSLAANRISYCLNLRGPSIAVDTACSSSLVATHLACKSIWDGECDLSIAGGVNVIILPYAFIGFSSMSMLSPDGRCKAFDASADGFVRGEGVGVVVLKPLSAALRDGDSIYSLICATGVNQDGRTSGITAPNQESQEALLRAVYARAGVPVRDVRYVEAHGTGTAVGDPIETAAIGTVLRENRDENDFCLIGSVKTNIGHLEAAAGIAGLIKTSLILKNGVITPNLHFRTPNPKINFDSLRLRVPRSCEPLQNGTGTIYAGVNSFGFGGTNAHAVLKQWRDPEKAASSSEVESASRPYLLPLTGRSPEALQSLADKYKKFLAEAEHGRKAPLADICSSASLRRDHFDCRLALVGKNKTEIVELLQAYLSDERRPAIAFGETNRNHQHKLAFVYSGQGPQWWAMGRQLFERESVYRDVIEECDGYIRALSHWSLIDELSADETESRVHRTSIAQPAIFALQVALTALLKSWGVEPQAVVGHSIGEVAAAFTAGVFGLEDAAKIVFHRGRCMDRASSSGRMLALAISEEEAGELIAGLEHKVSISAVNSPSSVTLSGDPVALENIAEAVKRSDVFCRFLRVEYAFHSPMMEPVREELLESLRNLVPLETRLAMASTVTGSIIGGPELDRDYWWKNVRQSVRFSDAVNRLLLEGVSLFLEISPHPALAQNLKECFRKNGGTAFVFHSLKRGEDGQVSVLSAVGGLFSVGYPLDWRKLRGENAGYTSLPGYPLQRKRYWNESENIRRARLAERSHPMLNRIADAAKPTWETDVNTGKFPYLKDHQVQGKIVFPGSAYLEMALAAGRELFGSKGCVLEEVDFKEALFLSGNNESPKLQLTFDHGDGSFHIFSRERRDTNWTVNARGRLRPADLDASAAKPDFNLIKQRSTHYFEKEEAYAWCDFLGLNYGPDFQCVEKTWRREGEALGLIKHDSFNNNDSAGYVFHPAPLDACLQIVVGIVPSNDNEATRGTYIPRHFDRVVLYRRPGGPLWSHALLRRKTERTLEGDLTAYSDDGTPVLKVEGLVCQLVAGAKGRDGTGVQDWAYNIRWRNKPLDESGVSPANADFSQGFDHIQTELTDYHGTVINLHHLGEDYFDVETRFEKLCHAFLLKTLSELGLPLKSGTKFSLESLINDYGVAERHAKAVRNFLNALTKSGYLLYANDEWEVARSLRKPNPSKIWKDLLARFPLLYAESAMMARIGRVLGKILKGELDVLEALFPEGSTALAEHLYQDSLSFRGYNEMASLAVAELIGLLPESRNVGILEIGAGTGGLTRNVLPNLPPNRTDYYFTDISNLFFLKAEQRFRNFPFLKYATLDIEKNPLQQGFDPHSFDIILASDVLHATRDIRETLSNILKLLSSNGVFIMLEGTKPTLFADFVFGLTDGWWRFTDYDIRPSHAFLGEKQWRRVLTESGFTKALSFSGLEKSMESLQAVFMALGPEVSPQLLSPTADQAEKKLRGKWLVFAEPRRTPDELLKAVKNACEEITIVCPGEVFQRKDGDTYEIPYKNTEAFQQFLNERCRGEQRIDNVIYAWGLDGGESDLVTPEQLESYYDLSCLGLVRFVQAQATMENGYSPRVFILTNGVYSVNADGSALSPRQAPLSGLTRVLINEHPEFNCKLIDLPPELSDAVLASLVGEIGSENREPEVVLRSNERFIPQVERLVPENTFKHPFTGNSSLVIPYKIRGSRRGIIDELHFEECERARLEPDQVEIRVSAAALNFRDVMKALGLYPTDSDDYMLFGDECAGVVTRVGEDVSSVEPGDEVFAVAPGCFGSYARSVEGLVFNKPESMTFIEAATLPIAFLTAYYCLCHIARLKRGEKVLIHAATGGVGLAAIQIAEKIGAEIFASAGSGKRWLLEEMGIKHVLDSRSVDFAEEIKRLTHGRGVDVVLNSLAGEAITKGIESLAPYGRFVEIGKRDIYDNSSIGLRPFKRNISFSAVDLGQVMLGKTDLICSIAEKLARHFEKGDFRPLPSRIYPISRLTDAFRHMSQAAHVGKLVFTMDDSRLKVKARPRRYEFKREATYLITGGFGGFGRTIARWMVERGARHLVLVGTRSAETDEARRFAAELGKAGAEVVISKTDVSKEDQVISLFETIDEKMPPLKGVYHAAMVLQDKIFLQLGEDDFHSVMAPKVLGAWNLHRHTSERDLDLFVLFSSITPLIGNPGQASYSAANAFLDTLAHYRRRLGLPAISISWGQLKDVGYVARHKQVEAQLFKIGSRAFSPQEAMAMLEYVLLADPIHVGATSSNWHTILAGIGATDGLANRFSSLLGEQLADSPEKEEVTLIREALSKAEPNERKIIISEYLVGQVARVLGTSSKKLNPDQSLTDVGLDSLMAIELKNKVESDLGILLPAAELMSSPTINRLTEVLAGQGRPAGPHDILSDKDDSHPLPAALSNLYGGRVVTLRDSGSRPPIFLIHPSGGGIQIYSHLAKVIPVDCPIHCIPSRVMVGEEKEHTSSEEVAHEYSELIAAEHPEGPCCCLGFSFGGIISISVAFHLEQMGRKVALVGILDPYIYPGYQYFLDQEQTSFNLVSLLSVLNSEIGIIADFDKEQLASKTRALSREITEAPSQERIDRVIEWCYKQNLINIDVPRQTLKKFVSLFDLHLNIIADFKPAAIRTPIYVWKTKGSVTAIKNQYDWSRLTTGGYAEEILDGDHFSIMLPPRVEILAERVGKVIEESCREPSAKGPGDRPPKKH